MTTYKRFTLLLVLCLVAISPQLVHASGIQLAQATPNTADGTVQPGGSCTKDINCADTGSGSSFQSYGCYIPAGASTGTCTLNGDQGATPHGTGAGPTPTGTGAGPTPNGTGAGPTPNGTGGVQGTLQNPLIATDIPTLLNEILGYVRLIGGIFLTLMIVVVGFMFVMARGNPEAVQQARSALLWTAIGGILLLGAQALAIVISTTVQSL